MEFNPQHQSAHNRPFLQMGVAQESQRMTLPSKSVSVGIEELALEGKRSIDRALA
jgi:hypothetical protein